MTADLLRKNEVIDEDGHARGDHLN